MTSAPEHRDHATAPIASRRSATFGLLILLAAVAVSWMRCGGHRMPPPSAIHPDIAAPPATQTALSEPLDAGTAMQRLPVRPSRWRVVDGGGRGLPGAVIVCSQPVRCVTAQDVLWQVACDADGHVAIPSTPLDALQAIVAAYAPGFVPRALDAKLLQAPGDIVLAPAGQPTVEIRDMAGKPVPGLAVACFCSPLTRIPSGAGLPGAVPGGFEVAITDDLGRVRFQHADPSRKYWIEFADRSLIVQSGDHVLPPTRSDAVILCPLGVARAMVSVVRFAPDVPDQIRVREAWWTYRLTIGGGTLFRLQRALYQEYPGCSALVALAKDVATTSEQVQVGLKGQTHPRWTEQHMTFVRPPDVDGERLVPMEVCFEDVALVDDAWLGIQIVDADGTGCHGLDLLVSSLPRPDTVVPMRSGEHRRFRPGTYSILSSPEWRACLDLASDGSGATQQEKLVLSAGEHRQIEWKLKYAVREIEIHVAGGREIGVTNVVWRSETGVNGSMSGSASSAMRAWVPVGQLELSVTGSRGAAATSMVHVVKSGPPGPQIVEVGIHR